MLSPFSSVAKNIYFNDIKPFLQLFYSSLPTDSP